MRLFIALPLASEVEAKLEHVITDLKRHDGAVKWVEPRNLHITLRFLGETDQSQVSPLKTAISQTASRFQSISTTLDKIGAFPNLKRPRAFWCGLASGVETLAQMAKEIETAVTAIDFPKEEKQFKAHLTLGRVREGADPRRLSEYLNSYILQPIPLTLNRIVLFKSTLTPKGPLYEQLHSADLGKQVERFG